MGILIDGDENVGIKRGSLDTRPLTAAFSVSGSTELTGSLLMTPGAGNTSIIKMENPTFEFMSSDATNTAYGNLVFRQTDGTTPRTILDLNTAGNAEFKGNAFIDTGYLRTPQLRDDTALSVQGPSVIIEGGSDSLVQQLFVHGTAANPVIGLKAALSRNSTTTATGSVGQVIESTAGGWNWADKDSGPQGAGGAQGATGTATQGATGTATQGTDGAQGGTGAQGTDGTDATGTQGAGGAQGATGTATQGATGTATQGATGAGTQGATGTGTQGETGATVQGTAGTQGTNASTSLTNNNNHYMVTATGNAATPFNGESTLQYDSDGTRGTMTLSAGKIVIDQQTLVTTGTAAWDPRLGSNATVLPTGQQVIQEL